MRSYVFVYNRLTGDLRTEEFDAGLQRQAFERRLELEQTVAPDTEVVVFHADSLDEIRKTHRRYFMSVQDMAQAGLPAQF